MVLHSPPTLVVGELMRQWSRFNLPFKCRTNHLSQICHTPLSLQAAAAAGCCSHDGVLVGGGGCCHQGAGGGAGGMGGTYLQQGVKRVEPGPGRQGEHEFSRISKDNRGTTECVAARAARGLRGNGNQWVKPAGPIRYPSNITPSPLPTKTRKRGGCWGAFECEVSGYIYD